MSISFLFYHTRLLKGNQRLYVKTPTTTPPFEIIFDRSHSIKTENTQRMFRGSQFTRCVLMV